MLTIYGNVGKLITVKEQYVAGVIFNWKVVGHRSSFTVTAERYFLDSFSPSRGKPIRCELWHGKYKWVGEVIITGQVALDSLDENISLEGDGRLCRKLRRKMS